MAARNRVRAHQRHARGCPRGAPKFKCSTGKCRCGQCSCPWTFRVELPDGRMRRITSYSYDEAAETYHRLMGSRGDPQLDRKTTVASYAADYMAAGVTLAGKPWALNTRLGVEGALRNHVIPGIGRRLMSSLTPADVRLWVVAMRDAGTGETVIDKNLKVAHAMFEAWRLDGGVLHHGNPVPGRLAVKKPWSEPWSPTTEQVKAWHDEMYPELQACFAAEAFYGGRMGEMIALRDDDILFDSKDVNAPLGPQLSRLAALPAEQYDARSAAVEFRAKIGPDRQPGPMKNARAYRTRPLPQWLAVVLAEHMSKWPPSPEGYLFVGRRPARGRHAAQGISLRPLEPTYYCRLVRQAATRAGIELPHYKSTHALRNFVVTRLRTETPGERSFNDDEAAHWIGDSGNTVRYYYGAKDEGVTRRMAAKLDAELTQDRPRLRAVD
jgi:integrase